MNNKSTDHAILIADSGPPRPTGIWFPGRILSVNSPARESRLSFNPRRDVLEIKENVLPQFQHAHSGHLLLRLGHT